MNNKFIDIADWVSEAMGTPINIVFWLLAVLSWFLLFAFNPNLQNNNFLPAWFTSNSFNFPLNSITTLAELYIGFLVAAAANRVEKRNRELQVQQAKIIQHIDATSSQEKEEVDDAEKKLLDQDARILALAQHLDQQDQELLRQTSMLQKIMEEHERKAGTA